MATKKTPAKKSPAKSVEDRITDALAAVDGIETAVVESEGHDIRKFDALLVGARTNLNRMLV